MTLAGRALLHPPLDNEMESHYSIHCSSILSAPHLASKLQSGDSETNTSFNPITAYCGGSVIFAWFREDDYYIPQDSRTWGSSQIKKYNLKSATFKALSVADKAKRI